jgi:hypothetical protein
VDRAFARGPSATRPGRPDTQGRLCYGPAAMQNDDEMGYRLSLVLFTVAIPIIGAIGWYLAAMMPA